jgi:hypothetical protein
LTVKVHNTDIDAYDTSVEERQDHPPSPLVPNDGPGHCLVGLEPRAVRRPAEVCNNVSVRGSSVSGILVLREGDGGLIKQADKQSDLFLY